MKEGRKGEGQGENLALRCPGTLSTFPLHTVVHNRTAGELTWRTQNEPKLATGELTALSQAPYRCV